MESMSLDQNALATFYCRREKYENNSVNFVTDPEEEVLSDVYHFRIRDVIDEITATFTIPIYAEPSDKQEIVLKFLAGKGGTQVIKEHVKSDEVKFSMSAIFRYYSPGLEDMRLRFHMSSTVTMIP